MDPIVSQLGAAGVVVAVLVGGMRWLSSRYEIMELKLDASAKACAERESALVSRLQSLEDSRRDELSGLIDATLESLRLSAGALRENSGFFRMVAEESGRHVIVRGKDEKDDLP